MKKFFVIICLLCLGISSYAQLFQTQSGIVQINVRYHGASVLATSNHLFMHLNYDKTEMHLRLATSTLLTGSDSLNELLQKLIGRELVFDGKMNIAFLQTKSHPKQKFATQGMLLLNGVSREFSFKSVLEHFPRGNTSCVLSGEFIIDLKQFNIENLLPGEEKVTVKFNQLVLKKPGE